MGTIRLDYNVQPVSTSKDSITIDANTRYQKVRATQLLLIYELNFINFFFLLIFFFKILGFGTSFTEAAAYTFSQQSAANQQKILNAYWYETKKKKRNYIEINFFSLTLPFQSFT
jgi:hypothetical protein